MGKVKLGYPEYNEAQAFRLGNLSRKQRDEQAILFKLSQIYNLAVNVSLIFILYINYRE